MGELKKLICPGCGQDVTRFMDYEGHYVGSEDELSRSGVDRRAQLGMEWPWIIGNTNNPNSGATVCKWTRDYLAAEYFRQYGFPA